MESSGQRRFVKCFAFLLSCVLLCLTGCSGGGAKQREIPAELSEKMQAYESLGLLQYGDLKATVAVEKNQEVCRITFQSPEELRGLAAVLQDGKTVVTYGNLSLDLTGDSPGGQFAGGLIVQALNRAAAQTGVTAELTADGFLLRGALEDGSYQLRLDGKTGVLISLDYPKEQLHLELYEFRFTEKERSA